MNYQYYITFNRDFYWVLYCGFIRFYSVFKTEHWHYMAIHTVLVLESAQILH